MDLASGPTQTHPQNNETASMEESHTVRLVLSIREAHEKDTKDEILVSKSKCEEMNQNIQTLIADQKCRMKLND